MKKFKKSVAVALSVCAVFTALSLSACSDGNDGEGTEKEPVTTVANNDEWKRALDLLSLNSFSMCDYDSFDTGVTVNGDIDLVNYKANFTSSEKWYTNYIEYSENKFWEYGDSGFDCTEVEPSEAKKFFTDYLMNNDSNHVIVSLYVLQSPSYVTAEDKENYKTLLELFSEFTYQDGYYVSDKIYSDFSQSPLNIKIAVKDGILSEFELTYIFNHSDKAKVEKITLKVDNVNSASVTAPSDARAAIDAEKAKG